MNLLELSQTIRKVRVSQKITVEQLAQMSGFSKGYISQVENFRITPSIKALIKISKALGIEVETLFNSDATGTNVSFGSLEGGVELQRDAGEEFGMKYLALAYSQLERKMDPFIIEYTPADIRELLSHESDEFFVVVEGEIEYNVYDENTPRILKKGDTVYLKANIPHSATVAKGCQYAKALTIYSDITKF